MYILYATDQFAGASLSEKFPVRQLPPPPPPPSQDLTACVNVFWTSLTSVTRGARVTSLPCQLPSVGIHEPHPGSQVNRRFIQSCIRASLSATRSILFRIRSHRLFDFPPSVRVVTDETRSGEQIPRESMLRRTIWWDALTIGEPHFRFRARTPIG